MTIKFQYYLIGLFLTFLISCNPKVVEPIVPVTIANIDNTPNFDFHYFANGHLTKEGYHFRSVKKDGRKAAEIIRASDAKDFSGMYCHLPRIYYISDGNRFTMDVWMDHLGTFTLKLEESTDGGPTITITTKNTKINQWETLTFDYSEDIIGGPTYPKIAIFVDLFQANTGKDVYTYFSNFKQHPSENLSIMQGDSDEAIKIVVLGSSTAAGTGPKEGRNAWVKRFRRQLQAINGHHQVINLARGGYTTFELLPTGTEVTEDRPLPDPEKNITKALSLNPDAVIINLPSNDAYRGYSIEEQLNNYSQISKELAQAGIPYWVSTPQGRNMEKDKRADQKILRDSTFSRFGRRTLDFWRDLANPDGTISKKYDSGDGVHLNDEGHLLLFEEVMGKEIVQILQDAKKGIVRKDRAYSSPLFKEGYVLQWQDEFNGNELDTTSWSHELGDGCPDLCGWGNRSKVWYKPENTQVKNGKLIITAKSDSEHEGYWSSSRLVTRDKVNFKYGRIDIRAKLPETQGLWPALWLLGQNRTTDGWPNCGEIDIMEEKGQDPYRVRGTVFYKGKDGKVQHEGDKYELKHGNFSDDFHVYSIDWSESGIKYYVDDQLYADRKFNELEFFEDDNPFLKPFYMLINCAVGGNYLGFPNQNSVFPQTFEVDYIRHYIYDKYYYCAKVEEKVQKLPKKENLWIYLMAGQSNMEGAGTISPQDTLSHPRILTMNKAGEWLLAKEPIHFHTNNNRGLDCGHSFANTLLSSVPDSVTIAIIPSAMGGSSIDHWLTDSIFRNMHLWSNLKSKINACENDGVFKGMIWHQGETDAKESKLPHYVRKLHQFFDKVRKEVNNPDMPVVVGELGKFQTHRPVWLSLNKLLADMAATTDNVSLIKTDDLGDIGDQIHFNGAGQRSMGIRYAQKMAALHQLPAPVLTSKIKIMTYNMRLDVASDGENRWNNRKEIFINQIVDISPGIFGTQEGLPHQIQYIYDQLGYYDYIGANRNGDANTEEYSAIFYDKTKFVVDEENTFWLSPTPTSVSKGWDAVCLRICTYGHFTDKSTGNSFWVFNTHLDHSGAEARKNSIDLIRKKIKHINTKGEPVIIMGDFNLEPQDLSIIDLSKEYTDSYFVDPINNTVKSGTFNAFDIDKTAKKRIDYIFFSKKGISLKGYRIDDKIIDGKYPSDHFPVIVDLLISSK